MVSAGARLAPFLLLVSFATPGAATGQSALVGDPPSLSFRIEEVELASLDEGITLAGTLTVPAGDGPFPAVVLLGVAGPNDRDQSIGRHRGFEVLAHRLAERGVASLRWDDRGVGGSGGDYFAASYDDLASDALGAVRLLSARPEIDREAVGAVGNSEGGAIGPLAAARSDELAFVVLLAGPGTGGIETIRLQLERAIARMGIPDELAAGFRESFARFVEIERLDPVAPATRAAMIEFLRTGGQALFPPYAFVPADTEELADLLLGPWYRSQLAYEPAEVLPGLEIPVLALVGDKDTVLPADPHLDRIGELLATHPDFTGERLPGLNHLFQTANTGSPLEYATLEEAFSPRAAEWVADWILERFGPPGQAD